MLGIKNIGVALGDTVVDNVSRAALFGKTESFVTDKIGFSTVVRADGCETSDLCCKAYADLCAKASVDIETIDCIVVCTQNPDGAGLPHTSALLHAKLNAPETVAAFDISLGCSGYVYGLSVVLGLMEHAGFSKGLLFTADPYSKVLDSDDAVTEMLFGDGATCTFISNDPVYAVGKTAFGTNGALGGALVVDPLTKKLHMDGRSIFNFTMRVVPDQISKCLELNNVTSESVDLFLLHQASRYIIENMAKRLGVPVEKVPFKLHHTGNLVSSTLPFMLSDYIESGPEKILLSGFGVGLSWASTVLNRAI
ncbi:ketoacyl-ACP synthase III [Desulfovibrio subterraneus]|uniref:3-oxoacyl-ACP synthase n=1 Tax=Desulfovibrio subterraneus TaxID=2718620 RepID=A0A7J0BNF1_9BACT|nr:ketoacyl-ACP synthase III [Desulfovibrio subterraneus]GFM35148.1 3-oxoacyl-ACP synthase [Desulfovibrio subterraneus]